MTCQRCNGTGIDTNRTQRLRAKLILDLRESITCRECSHDRNHHVADNSLDASRALVSKPVDKLVSVDRQGKRRGTKQYAVVWQKLSGFPEETLAILSSESLAWAYAGRLTEENVAFFYKVHEVESLDGRIAS